MGGTTLGWWKMLLFSVVGIVIFAGGVFFGKSGENISDLSKEAMASPGFILLANLSKKVEAVDSSEKSLPPKKGGDIKYFIEKTKESSNARSISSVSAKPLPEVGSLPVVAPTTTFVNAFENRTSSVAVVFSKGFSTSTDFAKDCHFETKDFPQYKDLIINEVAWMGTSEDSGHEWIELRNSSESPINIHNYWLFDKAEQIAIHFPDISISAGGFLVLERGDDDALPEIDADLIYIGALGNSNEGLNLFDAQCVLQDSVLASPKWPAGNSSQKRSMERGGDWEWYTFEGSAVQDVFGTPGEKNKVAGLAKAPPKANTQASSLIIPSQAPTSTQSSPSSASTSIVATSTVVSGAVFITEIFVGSEQSADDEYLELYNPGPGSMDLTGWSIKKKSSSGVASSLVSSSRLEGLVILPGKHILIAREGKYLGSVAPSTTWASSYSLAYTNNAVVLIDSSGVTKEEISWASITKGKSYGRDDSEGAIFSEKDPSPGQ
jgi:hypothetical protein